MPAFLSPIPDRPKAGLPAPLLQQLAALCWRKDAAGGREVLLVTSSTGRWILPKGWPIRGKAPQETALIEAWEEAGVAKGKVTRKPLGSFLGSKTTAMGDEVPCLIRVFAVKVRQTADDFPEVERRDRRWMTPAEAAALVTEDGLREILLRF